jgi:Uma2 family endonuclease
MELREGSISEMAEHSVSFIASANDDTVQPPSSAPLAALVREHPVFIRTKMPRQQFHQFVLDNSDYKIERNQYGIITIYPLMTLQSGNNEGEAFGFLWYWSRTNRIGKIFSPSTAFDLPDGGTYRADGAWISLEKLNKLTVEETDSIARIVPDFVMEMRSKTDTLAKLKKKMIDVWMANGVRLAWLLDPRHQKAWIYRKGQAVEEFSGSEIVLSGEDVLPGFVLDFKELGE